MNLFTLKMIILLTFFLNKYVIDDISQFLNFNKSLVGYFFNFINYIIWVDFYFNKLKQ